MKGTALDITQVFLFLFLLVMVFFMVSKTNTLIHQGINNLTVQAGLNGTTTDQIMNDSDNAISILVGSVPFITIGAGIIGITLAAFIPASPLFLPISLFLLVIFEILAAVFANFLFDFITNAMFIDIANANPLLVLLIEKLPWVIGVIWLLIIIVQYARTPTGETFG